MSALTIVLIGLGIAGLLMVASIFQKKSCDFHCWHDVPITQAYMIKREIRHCCECNKQQIRMWGTQPAPTHGKYDKSSSGFGKWERDYYRNWTR